MTYNCLEKARHYLENYADEIPSKILHNIPLTHKVSGGWFQDVSALFSIAYRMGLVDTSYKTKFYSYIQESRFQDRLTKKEDIEFADNLLREFIKDISS